MLTMVEDLKQDGCRQLRSLRELCLRTVRRYMSRDSVIPLLNIAKEVNLPESPEIIDQCTKFIIATFQVMVEIEGREVLENAIGPELVANLTAEAADAQKWRHRVRRSFGRVLDHGPQIAEAPHPEVGAQQSSAGEHFEGATSGNEKYIGDVSESLNIREGIDSCYYAYENLKQGAAWPCGVDPERREAYLSPNEFQRVFKISRAEFDELPEWRRKLLKRDMLML